MTRWVMSVAYMGTACAEASYLQQQVVDGGESE